MPYHGKDIRSSPVFQSHKAGRYVVDQSGFLRGIKGDRIDLHSLLTDHQASIEIVPIATKIMRLSGLHPGGFALIDRSKKVAVGSLVIVRYNDQVVIRRLQKEQTGEWVLKADDPREIDLPISEDVQVEKLGVVIAAIVRF